jgi:N-acetylmuramoyl-L-alanine amidase
VSDGQINLTPDETAIRAARDAMNGWDPSGGAIYYYNPNTAQSAWIWSRPVITTIGRHKFAA